MQHHSHAGGPPMNAADFRRAIDDAAVYATEQEPNDQGQRAQRFIAYLSGLIKESEPALAKTMRGLIGLDSEDAPTLLKAP
jgi:hypothetical protein